LEEDYLEERLHPADLKKAVAGTLSDMLNPVREYFNDNPENYEELKGRI